MHTTKKLLSILFILMITLSSLGQGNNNTEDFASLVLYPNPADSKVNLSNPRQIDLNNVTIYDLTGRIVNKIDLSTMGSEITIDISTLANATYMLVIKGSQGTSTKQLIVNNY